jgi:hypothetical protein
LMLVDMSGPKIKRFARLGFDSAMTESEKKGAWAQFFSALPSKVLPRAVLCWPDGMTFRQLSLPPMPNEDLVKAIDWDLKKKYYYEPEENLLGYKEALTIDGEEGPEKLYSIFYCENKTALPRIDFAFQLGLDVQGLIPTPVALARFCAASDPTPDKDVLICDLTDGVARIIAVRGEEAMLVRNVPLGAFEGTLTDEMLAKAAAETAKTIDFYESQKYARPIGKVYFTGALAQPVRILDAMTPKFGVPVSVPSVEKYLSGALDEADKLSALSEPGAFASAIGTVLSPDDSLNLVPMEIKTKNRRGKMTRLLNLGLVGFALLLASVLGLVALQLNLGSGRIDSLHKEFGKLNESRAVLENMLSRSRVRRETLKGDIHFYALLKDLSLRTPGTIVIQGLQYNRPDSTLVITGYVTDAKRDSQKIVTQFSTSLSESIFYTSAAVSRNEADEANQTVRFEIGAVVKGLSI